MKYYVKRVDTLDLQGPFTLEELNRRVASGELDSRWLATADGGETLEELRKAPEEDWSWLAEIQGVNGVAMPAEPRPKENDRVRKASLVLIVVGPLNLVVFLQSYSVARHAPDIQGFPAGLVAIACLILSVFLYMAGMMCVSQAIKDGQRLGRSIMGMIAGGSALIGLFLTKFFGR